MLHEPKAPVLDEPTARHRSRRAPPARDLLFELSGHGITFFVTTHHGRSRALQPVALHLFRSAHQLMELPIPSPADDVQPARHKARLFSPDSSVAFWFTSLSTALSFFTYFSVFCV